MTFTFKHSNTTFDLINYGTSTNIYFKAKDVASFLGYSDTKRAIQTHVWETNKTTKLIWGGDLSPQKFGTIFLNESGLYQLIFGSKLEMAKKFQEWVFKDVLPQIRQTGKYQLNNHSIKPNLTFKIENEYDMHKQLINFIKVKYPQILLSIQSGELQNETQQNRIKSYNMGYEAGSFDIIINNLHKKFNGFAIELKSPTGKGIVSERQLTMQKKYEMNNFKTLISNDYNETIFQIIEYMNETRIRCSYCSRKFKNSTSLKSHLTHFHKINI